MSNPLFTILGGNSGNGMPQLLRQFQQFRQTFSGDPKAQVQQLLNSGRVSQAQYDRAVRMAQELQKMLSK